MFNVALSIGSSEFMITQDQLSFQFHLPETFWTILMSKVILVEIVILNIEYKIIQLKELMWNFWQF